MPDLLPAPSVVPVHHVVTPTATGCARAAPGRAAARLRCRAGAFQRQLVAALLCAAIALLVGFTYFTITHQRVSEPGETAGQFLDLPHEP